MTAKFALLATEVKGLKLYRKKNFYFENLTKRVNTFRKKDKCRVFKYDSKICSACHRGERVKAV